MCSKTNDAAFCEWPCVRFPRASSLNNTAERCALQTRPQVHTVALNTHCVATLCKAVIFSFMLSYTHTHTHAEYQQGGWVWLPSLSFMRWTVPWISKSHAHMCGSHKTTTVTACCRQERHGAAGQKRFKKRWQEPRETFFCVSCAVSAPHLPSPAIYLCYRTLMSLSTQGCSDVLWESKLSTLQPALFSERSTFFFSLFIHLDSSMFPPARFCAYFCLCFRRFPVWNCLLVLMLFSFCAHCFWFLCLFPFFCIHLTGQSLSALLSFFGLCGPPHERFSDVRLHVVASYTLVEWAPCSCFAR